MAAGVFLPVFVVGRRVHAMKLGIAFPQSEGLIYELGDALTIYLSLLTPVMLGVLVYVTLLWPLCRWASRSILRVVVILAAPLVGLADVALPGLGWFTDYPLAFVVAASLFGLAVAAGVPDAPRRIGAAIRSLVLVRPQ